MSTSHSQKCALVLGASGLGGPALLVLSSAGVGRIILVEDGAVETADLSWQPLFREADLGRRKASVAAARLGQLFPGGTVEAQDRRLDPAGALELMRRADVLVDCSDDFGTKFLASDTAVATGKPLVHGGLVRYSAQLLTVKPGTTGCLRCLFEEPPPPGTVPTCAEAGVLGPLAGLVGALMGAEAVRLLAGERGCYAGRLVVYEARSARCRAVPVRRRPGCPSCSGVPRREEPAAAGGFS